MVCGKLNALFVIVAASLVGCIAEGEPIDEGTETSEVSVGLSKACTPESARTNPVEVFALPEAGTAPFVNEIAKAKTSIRMMIYELNSAPIVNALLARVKAGVSVQVIFDADEKAINQAAFDTLENAGAECKWSLAKFSYMHAKAFVVDDAVAVITSSNFVTGYMSRERNFVAVDRDADDARSLAAVFDADWNNRYASASCTRLVISPNNSRSRVLAFIDSATKSVRVESMQLQDSAVRRALADRQAAGVNVEVILADPRWITANKDAATFLKANGIAVRSMSAPDVHVKSIVVDDEKAYLGSENFTTVSFYRNREIGLVVTEKANAQLMSATFTKDWASATAM